MGRMVVVVYRPKPGCEQELAALIRTHVFRLRTLNLATDRPSLAMTATNGDIVEAFEWVSAEAMAKAHEHPAVLEMWAEFEQVCSYQPLKELDQAGDLFAEFTPLEVEG